MEKIKVLIASNSTLFSRTLSRMISAENRELILTRDENEVVEHLSKKEIDICFLRDSLSNALEICERFSRSPDEDISIPIIIYSPQSGVKNRALEKGASGFLKVPCEPKEVLALVDQWGKLTQRQSTPLNPPYEEGGQGFNPPQSPLQEGRPGNQVALNPDPIGASKQSAESAYNLQSQETSQVATETTPTESSASALSDEPSVSDADLKDTTAGESKPEVSEESPLILLVDDSRLIHRVIGDILKDDGFRVVDALDGVEGFDKAQEFMPDLIISDIDMPNCNGYEMCRKIKETEKTQNIPIVMLSARGGGIDIDKGFDVGVNDFLTKPVEANELVSRIRLILGSDEQQTREKILVVEDLTVQRNFISQGLSQQGFDVVTAADGQEGLEVAIEQEPALVITDLDMPIMNGRDLCREIRKNEVLKDIPVIMLTASDSKVDEAKGRHAGVDAYLSKPFSPDKLVVVAERLISEKNLTYESERRLRLIVEATPVPIIISRRTDGEILYVNQIASSFFGLETKEVLGRKMTEFYHDPADWQQSLDRLALSDAVDDFELQIKGVDENLLWVAVALRPLEFNGQESVLAALHDITERKQAEVRLKEQVEALRIELDDARQTTEVAQTTGTAYFRNLDAAVQEDGVTKLIAIHSFRGGVGKSNLTANIAALLAAGGRRVGVIDTDIQSPGIHVLFGQAGQKFDNTVVVNMRVDTIARGDISPTPSVSPPW